MVDVACVVIGFLLNLLAVGDTDPAPRFGATPYWFNLGLAIVGALALLLRRRWPVALTVVMILASTSVPSVGGSAGIALFSVAVHRRPAVSLSLGAAAMASCLVQFWLYPVAEVPNAYAIAVSLTALACLAIVAWGIVVRTRRQLMASLTERAVRGERERIAREMHDALGHRLSLLSVHAGALEFRPDMPADELSRAAGVIRTSARDCVEDLREIVGVLRTDGPRIAELVAESQQAGMVLDLTVGVELTDVPESIARHAHRIIQEGLTNARKHAPHQRVRLTVGGAPGAELEIELINRLEPGSGGPGSQVGLIGLTERAALAGGRIEYGPIDGEFRLAAWLPWTLR